MSIKPKEKYIHPIILSIEENITKDDIYPTQLDIGKKKNMIYSKKEPEKQLNIILPSMFIDFSQYLKYYKIESVDDILKMVSSDFIIYKKKRILNAWIRINFIDLKKNNKIISKIFVHLFRKEYDIEFDMGEINKIIISWFKKNDKDIFDIDLYDQIFYYLQEKNIL
jgi:hypothetical protein